MPSTRPGDSFPSIGDAPFSPTGYGSLLTFGGTYTITYDYTPVTVPSRSLSKLSTRVRADVGTSRAIVGFTISGTASKRVVMRGLGPELVPRGVTNAISNPKLTVYNLQGGVIAPNGDWQSEIPPAAGVQTFAVSRTNFGPTDSRESAIGLTLPPGGYTAFADGENGETGVT